MAEASPFIGPRPFTEQDAARFFGRESDLAALVAEVISTEVVLLYAASGSGKTSLISAGLIPAMREEGFHVSQVRIAPAATRHGGSDLESAVAAIRQAGIGDAGETPSLLILDQFEEFVVAFTHDELHHLSEAVRSAMAANPLARTLISFREEYLARVDGLFATAPAATLSRYQLDRLTEDGAVEAFERSLATVGFSVERNAAEAFVDKLMPPTRRVKADVGFEPLYLQLLGAQLWGSVATRTAAGRAPDAVDHVVTVEDVERLVDFDQAVEVFFNSTIRRVCRAHGVAQKAVRDWIDRELVTPDETRSMVRRRPTETNGLRTSVIDALVMAGLLRTEPRGDDLWIELAHDQLVERVREFNRAWWTGRVHGRLRERGDRFGMASEAAQRDQQRWVSSRMMLWNLASGVRESGIQLSRGYGRWLPFARQRSEDELDRLALRAFVLTGSLVNAGLGLYRTLTAAPTSVQQTLDSVEGLDADAAKRMLRATALNLGRTDQALAATNAVVTFAWLRLVARIAAGFAIGDTPVDRRRRLLVGAVVSADFALTLLRWAVRSGLIANCLGAADQVQRVRALGRDEDEAILRILHLEDVASWSRHRPVLLVLDWRSNVDGTRGFERFVQREVPLYRSAVRARSAAVAWCCRADVRGRGWRDGVSGLGFPARGQRVYYMIEAENVVAWRTVRSYELPVPLRSGVEQATHDAPASNAEVVLNQRFSAIMTSLIVRGEAMPPIWRDQLDQALSSALLMGRRGATSAARQSG